MGHWLDTYPHEVYVSAVLYEGKLFDYKIGQHKLTHVNGVYMKISDIYVTKDITIELKSFTVNNSNEHDDVFTKHAREFLNKYKVHPESSIPIMKKWLLIRGEKQPTDYDYEVGEEITVNGNETFVCSKITTVNNELVQIFNKKYWGVF